MKARGVRSRQRQRGQSMTEFMVGLAVLLPLFLAVNYAGRYVDIQQSAIQASRYAAFQRAMQPDPAKLSDAKLQDQMRARFFVHGNYLHSGAIQSDDTVVGLRDQGTSAAWRDMSGQALLQSPVGARLTMGTTALDAGLVADALGLMSASAGKHYNGAVVARVEVDLVNKLDLRGGGAHPWSIAAATAAAGDNLSSSGSQATRDAAATIVPSALIPSALDSILSLAMLPLERSGPDFGCIKPDVVPVGRLEGYAPAGGCR